MTHWWDELIQAVNEMGQFIHRFSADVCLVAYGVEALRVELSDCLDAKPRQLIDRPRADWTVKELAINKIADEHPTPNDWPWHCAAILHQQPLEVFL